MAAPHATKLKDQVKHALDEALILITGVEILIGFQYTGIFNKGFESLPRPVQYLQLVGLALLLVALILIMSPVSYHRITAQGHDTRRFCRFLQVVILAGLLPFALGLAIDVYIIGYRIDGPTLAIIGGTIAGATALFFWYVFEFLGRRVERHARMIVTTDDDSEDGAPKLADKVDHVLTETRVVLPGAQALLGFQFASVLVEGFDKLSPLSKYLHLTSLALIALTTILLMTPAAYHRIVERGEDTEHFQRLAGIFILAAMVTLALGITINFYVVVDKVTQSPAITVLSTGVMLILFYGFWFGYTWYRRERKGSQQRASDAERLPSH